MASRNAEWQYEAFKEMAARYFGADAEKATDAFVFYYIATTTMAIPTLEDLAWAKKKLGMV
jgi:hypothetical protein